MSEIVFNPMPDLPPVPVADQLTIVQRVGRRVVAATMAVVSLLGVSAEPHTAPEFTSQLAVIETNTGPNHDVREYSLTAHPLPGDEVTQTPDPDPYTLSIANLLIQQPSDPEVEKQYSQDIKPDELTNKYGPQTLEIMNTHFQVNIAKTSYAVASEAARQHNQTVYDTSPYVKRIVDARVDARKEGKKDAPFSVYYENAKAYMAQFGVDFSIEDGSQPMEKGREAVTAEGLENSQIARQNLVDLINGFALVTQDYVDLAGLHHMRWVSEPGGGFLAYVTFPEGGTIYTDIFKRQGPSTYRHELSHLVNLRTAGKNAVDNNPGWSALNPADIYTEGTEKNVHPQDTFTGQTLPLLNQQFEEAVRAGDFDTAKSIQEQINHDAEQVNLEDRGYGGSHTEWQTVYINDGQEAHILAQKPGSGIEDWAEVGKNLAEPGAYFGIAYNHYPILSEKFIYELAVIGTYNPDLMGYLFDIGRRKLAKDESQFDYTRHLVEVTTSQAATRMAYESPQQDLGKGFNFAEESRQRALQNQSQK